MGGERTRIRLAEGLKEERSGSWSASAEWHHSFGRVATNLIVEGFYTTLDDVFALREVGADSDGATIQERYNGSGATVGGVNLEGRATFGDHVELQAGFTWQESRYKEAEYWSEDEAVAPSKRMFRTPDTYGYFTLTIQPWERFDIDLSGNYTGSMLVQHYAGSGTDVDVAVKTPSFFDANLRLQYSLKLFRDVEMEIYGGMKNLFNAYQDDFDTGAERDSGYVYGPMMPRSWFIGTKIRF